MRKLCLALGLCCLLGACGSGADAPAALADTPSDAATGPQMSSDPPGVTIASDSRGDGYYDGAMDDLVRFAMDHRGARPRHLHVSDNFALVEVSVETSGHYRYAVFDHSGALLADDLKIGTPPSLDYVSRNFVSLHGSGGANAHWAVYYDLYHGTVSDTYSIYSSYADFYDSAAPWPGRLLTAYTTWDTLRVEEVFPTSALLLELEDRDKTITDIVFIDAGALYVTREAGEGERVPIGQGA